MKLSIIIPVYNEESTLEALVGYVQSVRYPMDYEIIIVDDASADGSYEKGQSLQFKSRDQKNQVRLFRNEVNKGKGFSLRKGIQEASGDYIIIQDADTEYDPNEIPKLLAPMMQGHADVIYGSRFLENSRPKGMAFANWVANKTLTVLTNILYGLNLTDMETCYKLFKADMLKSLDLKTNRFSFEPEVTALTAKKKLRILEVPIQYLGRKAGEGKKIKAIDFFDAVLTLFRCRF